MKIDKISESWITKRWISKNERYRQVVQKKWRNCGLKLIKNSNCNSIIKSHIWNIFEKIVGIEILTGQDLSEEGKWHFHNLT
jgi:hypothetical protein